MEKEDKVIARGKNMNKMYGLDTKNKFLNDETLTNDIKVEVGDGNILRGNVRCC